MLQATLKKHLCQFYTPLLILCKTQVEAYSYLPTEHGRPETITVSFNHGMLPPYKLAVVESVNVYTYSVS